MDENNVEEEIVYEDLVDEISKNITPEIIKLFKMRDPKATKETIIAQMDPLITGVGLVEEDKSMSLQETARKYLAIAIIEEQGRAYAVNLLEETPSRPGFQELPESKMDEYIDLVSRCDIPGMVKYNVEKCKIYSFPPIEDGSFQAFPLTRIEASEYDKLMQKEMEFAIGVSTPNKETTKDIEQDEREEVDDDRNSTSAVGSGEVTKNDKDTAVNQTEHEAKPTALKPSDVFEVNKEATQEYNKNNPGTKHHVVVAKEGIDTNTYLSMAKRYAAAKNVGLVVLIDGVELKVKEFESVDEMLKTAESIKYEKDGRAAVEGAAKLTKQEVLKQQDPLGGETRVEEAATQTNSQQDLLQQLLKQQNSKTSVNRAAEATKMQEADLINDGMTTGEFTPTEVEEVASTMEVDPNAKVALMSTVTETINDKKFGSRVENMKSQLVRDAKDHEIQLNGSTRQAEETLKKEEEDRTLGPNDDHESGR